MPMVPQMTAVESVPGTADAAGLPKYTTGVKSVSAVEKRFANPVGVGVQVLEAPCETPKRISEVPAAGAPLSVKDGVAKALPDRALASAKLALLSPWNCTTWMDALIVLLLNPTVTTPLVPVPNAL